MSLARFVAKKMPSKEVDKLLKCVVNDFSKLLGLQTIILFGSAARGTMIEGSDLDVVLVLDSSRNRDLARKTLFQVRKSALWPMDILCTDLATFKRKSRVGGVFYVARDEGKVLFGKMP